MPDASATRYQQTEVPPLEPHTTEWRRPPITCPCCDYKTRAAYDGAQIPSSPFGPARFASPTLSSCSSCTTHSHAYDVCLDPTPERLPKYERQGRPFPSSIIRVPDSKRYEEPPEMVAFVCGVIRSIITDEKKMARRDRSELELDNEAVERAPAPPGR